MNQKSSKTPLIVFISVLVVGALIYFYTLGNPSDSSLALSSGSSDTSAQTIGANVLTLLGQISSLKIDTSIFSSTAYKSLVDYSITVPEQNVGRVNPFESANGFQTSSVGSTSKSGLRNH